MKANRAGRRCHPEQLPEFDGQRVGVVRVRPVPDVGAMRVEQIGDRAASRTTAASRTSRVSRGRRGRPACRGLPGRPDRGASWNCRACPDRSARKAGRRAGASRAVRAARTARPAGAAGAAGLGAGARQSPVAGHGLGRARGRRRRIRRRLMCRSTRLLASTFASAIVAQQRVCAFMTDIAQGSCAFWPLPTIPDGARTLTPSESEIR